MSGPDPEGPVSPEFRAYVLSCLRLFTADRPLFVGNAVMREALKHPDLAELVAEGRIVETPMLPV